MHIIVFRSRLLQMLLHLFKNWHSYLCQIKFSNEKKIECSKLMINNTDRFCYFIILYFLIHIVLCQLCALMVLNDDDDDDATVITLWQCKISLLSSSKLLLLLRSQNMVMMAYILQSFSFSFDCQFYVNKITWIHF